MAPVTMSVTMFSLLLLMMIDVVQCSTVAKEAHNYFFYKDINKANAVSNQLAKPDAYYIGSNKEHLIEQIRARISMTQPTIDELTQLYKAKLGDITKSPGSKEFDPDDQVKAKQLLDKLKDSHVWFDNLLRLDKEQNELKGYYSKVEANEKLFKAGFDMLSSWPKVDDQRLGKAYLDGIRMELNKAKQTLDKAKQFYGHELDNLNSDVVERDVFIRFLADKIYSDYVIVVQNMDNGLTKQCKELQEKLDDELPDEEKPQDDEQLKKAKAALRDRRKFREEHKVKKVENPDNGSQKDKNEFLDDFKQAIKILRGEVLPPIPNIGTSTSSQEDDRPFWKKKRYNIPASLGGLVFAGWLLNLQNKIPQMIWGSKEDDASTKVNSPNSTTADTYIDTSTDAPTHQVEYLTVVIIVLVVLALLVVGFVVLFKGCKKGSSDLERGEASHKTASTSTTTGTETALTPTRSTNATSSKAKSTPEAVSKKDSAGPASTSVSTKTKSKGSSQK